MTHHFIVLGLSALTLVGGSLLQVENDAVLLGDTSMPSVCWLRHTPSEGCPGCGLTRSAVAFCHFRWRLSFSLHPAGWLVVVLALLQFPYRLTCMVAGKRGRTWASAGAMGRFALFMVLALALARWVGRIVR